MQKQSQTIIGLWSTLKGALKDVLITIGDSLMPVVKDFMRTFITLAQGPLQVFAKSLSKSLIPIFQALGEILPKLLKCLGPILDGVGKILIVLLNGLMPVFDLLDPILKFAAPLIAMLEGLSEIVAAIIEPLVPLLATILEALLPFVNIMTLSIYQKLESPLGNFSEIW